MNRTEKAISVAPKTVTCPSCGMDALYTPSNPFRPFCSARCKNTDLGAWASESFRMPVNPLPEDQTGDEAPPSSAGH